MLGDVRPPTKWSPRAQDRTQRSPASVQRGKAARRGARVRTETRTRRPQRRGPYREAPASVRQARAARRGVNDQSGQHGRVVKAAGSEPEGLGFESRRTFRQAHPHARQRPHSVRPLTAQRPQAGTPHDQKAAVTAPGLAAAGTPEGRPIRPRGRPRTGGCGRSCSPRPRRTAAGTPRLRTSGHGESRRPHGGPSDSNFHGRPHCPHPLCPWPLRCVRSQGQPTAPRADLEKDEAVNQRPPHSGPAHKRTGGQAGMGSGLMAGQADPCTGPRADEGEWARANGRRSGRWHERRAGSAVVPWPGNNGSAALGPARSGEPAPEKRTRAPRCGRGRPWQPPRVRTPPPGGSS